MLLLLQIQCPFYGTLESLLLGGVFFFASMTTGNVALLSRFPFDVYPTLHFSLLLSISFSLSVQFAPFLPLLPTCLTAEENEQRKRDERETRVSVLGGGGR